MGLSDLTWTTRAEVASVLLDHLQGTHPLARLTHRPSEDSSRERVAGLLSLVATTIHRNGLLALALDPKEEFAVRRAAVLGLERIAAVISGDDLKTLFDADDLWKGRFRAEDRASLLSLARSPGAEAVAQQYLLMLTAHERATLLVHRASHDADTPSRLGEWLYRQWLDHDRLTFRYESHRRDLNRQVIRRTLSRPESRRVLQEFWRASAGDQRRGLLYDLDDEECEWSFPDPLTPGEEEELARELALPVSILLARFGRRGLKEALEKTLAAEQRALAGAGMRSTQVSEATQYRLRVLRHWQDPEVDPWLAGHALGARFHPKLRRQLLWRLWKRNRPMASTVLATALRAGDRELCTTFLKWVAGAPQSCDRELLEEAFQARQPAELRYLALCGLDRLDADPAPAWASGLSSLARLPDVDENFRMRALGALARRGDADALQELTLQAESGPELISRAEAVGLLGEVAPGVSLPVLKLALEQERRAPNQTCAPAAEEAALALARLATPEARTLLLQAYLFADTWSVRHALVDYLAAVVETPVGETPLVWPPEMNWRRMLRIE